MFILFLMNCSLPLTIACQQTACDLITIHTALKGNVKPPVLWSYFQKKIGI